MKKTVFLFIMGLVCVQFSKGIGPLEMKDTYFHRFFDYSIMSGKASVGKYNIDLSMGKENSAWGFILDFPNDVIDKVISYDQLSQCAGFMLTSFSNQYDTPITNAAGESITGTAMNTFSLVYGWNVYQLPLRTNLYAGFNLFMGTKTRVDATAGEIEEKIFAPAPYFYFNNYWSDRFLTKLHMMVGADYKDLAKTAFEAVLKRRGYNVDFMTERNGSEYNDSYESSFALTKNFGSAWFFTNVVGLFWPALKNAAEQDSAGVADSYAEMDKTFGGAPGFFKMKVGTAFDVNNLAGESFADRASESDNYFGKIELNYILGMGFSYRVENGFGWKFGLNYGIDLDEAGSNIRQFSGKTLSVGVEYMKNYINDDVLGLRVDPSLFRINMAIR